MTERRVMTITFPEQFNMATYYLDDRIKEGRGDKVAVYCEDQKYTYADVQGMANQVGNVLLGLGVEMEDRVLIALPDSIEFVATWFAIAKIGAVIAMVHGGFGGKTGNHSDRIVKTRASADPIDQWDRRSLFS
jgi:acyl-coenzyme A synthetase/AMP-(fatty) acid ligase